MNLEAYFCVDVARSPEMILWSQRVPVAPTLRVLNEGSAEQRAMVVGKPVLLRLL